MHISAKCSLAIHCLLFLHEYGDEYKITGEILASSTGANPVIIRNILSALKKDNIIQVKAGKGGAKICCNPEEITLYRVYAAIEPNFLNKLIGIHQFPSPFCPIGKNIHTVLDLNYSKVRADIRKSLESITLKDVIADYHSSSK